MVLSAASVRPFGRAADLDVPFEGVDRPFLVTALLSECSEDADAEAWWAQRVSCRIAALLRLAALSDGVESPAVRLTCPQPACGADFEISLPASVLGDDASPHAVAVSLPDGRQLAVRQPTGDDQRRWSSSRYASQDDAVAAILEALVIDGPVTGDDRQALPIIAAALSEQDPLVDFTVSCECPDCGQPTDVAIDLEGLALSRLATVRRALLIDVHVLASAYGWTEPEILAIPPQRRARYRAFIDGTAG